MARSRHAVIPFGSAPLFKAWIRATYVSIRQVPFSIFLCSATRHVTSERLDLFLDEIVGIEPPIFVVVALELGDRVANMADIRHSISISVTRERVFPLIASGSGFTRWWAADVIEDYSTRIVEVAFFNRATVYRFEPIHNSAPWTAEWACQTGKEWIGTRLLFELTETSGKTQLRFTHADWKAETAYFVSCTKVWEELMLRLKAAAEGESLGPMFSTDRLAS